MSIVICLFAKAPIAGKAKTRLIPALGAQGAAALSRAMLIDTVQAWEARANRLLIACSGKMDDPLVQHFYRHERMAQGDGDLGAKMERALRKGLQDSEIACVVGADIPTPPLGVVRDILNLMEGHDAVLCPAHDGGFTLLALRDCPEGLLGGIAWSQPDTFEKTIEKLEAAGLKVGRLPPCFDVDVPQDLPLLGAFLRKHPRAMPHTRAFIASDCNRSISVIIPVLNEEERLGSLLETLGQHAEISEIIVVDGGSTDASIAIAKEAAGVTVLQSPPGRALQMNCGAARASGGILLFLHADVELPANALVQIQQAVATPKIVAGAFRLQTQYDPKGVKRWWVAPFLKLADMRSHYSNLPYGDQGLFVRAETFRLLGGFPKLPLFEDLALSFSLRSLGPLKILESRVKVSGRRFQQRPFYYLALMNTFPVLYRLGVSPAWLAQFYNHTR